MKSDFILEKSKHKIMEPIKANNKIKPDNKKQIKELRQFLSTIS